MFNILNHQTMSETALSKTRIRLLLTAAISVGQSLEPDKIAQATLWCGRIRATCAGCRAAFEIMCGRNLRITLASAVSDSGCPISGTIVASQAECFVQVRRSLESNRCSMKSTVTG